MAKRLMNNIEASNNAIDVMMAADRKIVLYGQDAGFEGGVFRATAGLQEKYGKDRVWDSPISEASQTGVAVGLGLYGYKAIAEIQFSGFSFPGFLQLFANAARYRNRSRSRYTVPMVYKMPVGGGVRALEHHSEALEALYAHIPGLKVVFPSNPEDTKGLMIAAIKDPDPVVFMEHKHLYRAFKQEVEEGIFEIEIGKAKKVSEGDDITIVAWGYMVHETIKALQEMAEKGIAPSAEIIDLRTISPWDKATILESVRKTGRLVVVTEEVKSFSVAAEIMATVADEAFDELRAPVTRVSGFDITVPLAKLEAYHTPNKDKIAAHIAKVMRDSSETYKG
ncbi:pyruvate dehydrogenase E1 component beta subunit [Mycoplasma testudineum]|uniref:Pyruvate dehydrogenase E1 component beta subunit n=1 Tax=Mycoplasma testudineum TaxID=244584 RepID=A0A4R6IE56_9MOLU|nr:alpha-ketoacid dehydrogenase subunit beta [Mycoplasma testudineum]OYD26772.1 alpha-ketoacid dehydrogenase subunit beta [Mycoplasma testudineum]TDO19907.1 pyruvate dehydrogenase E1 component beta subunit [Mycoplasma testudineum]